VPTSLQNSASILFGNISSFSLLKSKKCTSTIACTHNTPVEGVHVQALLNNLELTKIIPFVGLLAGVIFARAKMRERS